MFVLTRLSCGTLQPSGRSLGVPLHGGGPGVCGYVILLWPLGLHWRLPNAPLDVPGWFLTSPPRRVGVPDILFAPSSWVAWYAHILIHQWLFSAWDSLLTTLVTGDARLSATFLILPEACLREPAPQRYTSPLNNFDREAYDGADPCYHTPWPHFWSCPLLFQDPSWK